MTTDEIISIIRLLQAEREFQGSSSLGVIQRPYLDRMILRLLDRLLPQEAEAVEANR